MSTVEESQVRVVPYHSDWPILYENEAQRLRTIRSGIAVDEPPRRSETVRQRYVRGGGEVAAQSARAPKSEA